MFRVTNEEFNEDTGRGITQALRNLAVKKECLIIEADKRPVISVIIARLKKETGMDFTTKKTGDVVKIWKLK